LCYDRRAVPEKPIHPTACVHPDARLGKNVRIGAFSQIHAGVHLGDNTRIESYCELGYSNGLERNSQLVIGANSLIRSHSVFYLGSRFEAGLQTGHRVTVRENTTAGDNLHLGTLCDIQGDCRLGNFCRLHSNVTRQGVSVEDYAVIATLSVLLPGTIVGEHALVGAGSVVHRDVPARTLVAGNPARIIKPVEEIRDRSTGQPMYPWPRHFHRGYPDHVRKKWHTEFAGNKPDTRR